MRSRGRDSAERLITRVQANVRLFGRMQSNGQVAAAPVDAQSWRERERLRALLGSCPRSLGTITAAAKSWFHFAEYRLHRSGDALAPDVDGLLVWSGTFKSAGTFSNYVSALRTVCEARGCHVSARFRNAPGIQVLRLRTNCFAAREVGRAREAISNRNPRERPVHRFLLHDDLLRLLPHVADPTSRALFIPCFAFALRLPSECLGITVRHVDSSQHFVFSCDALRAKVTQAILDVSEHSATLHLSRRKNVPHPCKVTRECWCTKCQATCPVHAPMAALGSVPTGARPFVHLRRVLADGAVQARPVVVRQLRSAARTAGIPQPEELTSKCLRRGHAETVRRAGGRLGDILRAGGWSSCAFKEYLDRPDLECAATSEAVSLASAAAAHEARL